MDTLYELPPYMMIANGEWAHFKKFWLVYDKDDFPLDNFDSDIVKAKEEVGNLGTGWGGGAGWGTSTGKNVIHRKMESKYLAKKKKMLVLAETVVHRVDSHL